MQKELYYFIAFLIFSGLVALVVIFCFNNKRPICRSVELVTIKDRKVETHPKGRIVQTYKTRQVPKPMYHCAATFQFINPEYNYYFYTDKQARKFLKKHFDQTVVKAFDLLIPGAFKADLFRICELYINGGFYADICMVPLVDLNYFEKYETELILVRDLNINDIYNAFIYSVPGHKFLEFLINRTVQNVLARNMGETPLDITGPKFIGRCWKEFYRRHIDLGYHESEKILILDHSSGSVFDFQVKIANIKYPGWEIDRPAKTRYDQNYRDNNVFRNSHEIVLSPDNSSETQELLDGEGKHNSQHNDSQENSQDYY